MRNCREISELLSMAQDKRLSFFDRLGLRMHLAMCDGCSNFAKRLDILKSAMRQYRE
ncbi:MAG: zf-HC2 domain-containing protein [Betaproteobacteria bacterium]